MWIGPPQPWHKQRPNKLPIKCNNCGYMVKPNEGIIYRECAGSIQWTGLHLECPESDGSNDDYELRWDQTWGG